MDRRDFGQRRSFLAGLAGLPLMPLAASAQEALEPTPACEDADEPTPEQIAGPFYKPRSPQRSQLREPGMSGTPLTLTGYVLSVRCRPLPSALVELWHADDAGRYDLDGFRLRGHQFTDDAGRYAFETIVPGLYPGRTRHFHVRFQVANQSVLTTQFYFPGEPRNARDGLFHPDLLVRVGDGPSAVARFDTVLAIP